MGGNHWRGLKLSLLGLHTRSSGSYQLLFGPKSAFLRTYRNLMDPDGFNQVKNGWESLEGTKTEWLDPILSLLGLHTRSQGSYQLLFGPKRAFLRTYRNPMDLDCFDQVKNGWESLEGTKTYLLNPILSILRLHTRSQGSYKLILGWEINYF